MLRCYDTQDNIFSYMHSLGTQQHLLWHAFKEVTTCLAREAFGAWLPFWGVPASYAVAIGYVLTDTADKGNKAYKEAKFALTGNDKLHPEVNTPRSAFFMIV